MILLSVAKISFHKFTSHSATIITHSVTNLQIKRKFLKIFSNIKKKNNLILNFIIYINYVFTEKGKVMTRAKRIDTGRQKRASGLYSVELLIVVDYAVYQR